MHCIGEYPTQESNYQMNQIDLLRTRYNVPVGYSTHEDPRKFDSIVVAIAKGYTFVIASSDLFILNNWADEAEQVISTFKA